MLKLVSRFAGDPNEKELDRLQPLVDKVAELESSFKDFTDRQLRSKTSELLARHRRGQPLDDLLPEAFAAVREASKRTTAMRHFDVQILGGIILHQGKVVEMRTGEGKTLVATLPLYLNGLTGQSAHLVTVNDYLARRDVQWMGPIYHLLGLSVGLLQQGQDNAFLYDPDYTRGKFARLRPVDRQEAYRAHITYGTNHEFGFDYLRDNLAFTLERRVQRELHYAIIDEVDNILIDEARTPLIISGPSDEPLEEYRRFAHIARKLQPDIDYEVDEKERNVILTDAGLAKVEAETGIDNIYDEANYQYVHYMEQALRAQVLFRRDRDYIKQGQGIVLVDEFTGRLMPDRRLSEGLHQAIEAKEGVRILPRMMTQATITLQNYFRMYDKLAGMTGTAATEAEELDKIYKLDVNVLPTNVEYMARSPHSTLTEGRRKENGVEVVVYYEDDDPGEVLFYKRIDYQDVIYKTEKAKWAAIAEEIKELHSVQRPVLVGTTSVEKSERLSAMLQAQGIPHEVLNAKNHTREAAIIARAGEPGAVTIATNMAGRGVDIKLGGELPEETIKAAHRLLRGRGIDPYQASPAQLWSAIAEVDADYVRRREKVLELSGLHVLGTERHEARRIDNQLRGRAGRQGEPGSSRFYLSLEDDLMRRFGGPSVASLMDRLGVEEDIPIEHGLVSKTIEGAQTKVEGYNFDIRKHLLEYDDVLNRQREIIYGRRYQILTASDLRSDLWQMLESDVDHWLNESVGRDGDLAALISHLDEMLPLSLAPPDAPLRYQFSFVGGLTCFPPFSISFLAERLGRLAPQEIPGALLELAEQGSAEYRRHLLENAVRDRIDGARHRYQEDQERYAEFLENKIDDYVDLMEEQGREPSSQDLIQYVQSVFPVPLKVKAADLRGLSLSEAKEHLLSLLERAYHQQLCETLILGTQVRMPDTLRLERVKVADVDSSYWQAFLSRALSAAPDEATRGQLSTMAERKGSLLDLLLGMNLQVNLDLDSLGNLLEQAVAIEYDRWAERELEEMQQDVEEKAADLKDASAEPLTRFLLGVVYAEKGSFDKAHKRRVSFVPRLPLPFLAIPLVDEIHHDELGEVILDQLDQALLSREDVWGRQEVSRLGQRWLSELGDDFYEGLAEHLGEAAIEEVRDQVISNLDEDLYDQLRVYLGMRELEEQKLAQFDMYDELTQFLRGELERELEGKRIADLEEAMIRQVEEHLMEQGYFEDAAAREELLRAPLGTLDSAVREGIASQVGQGILEGLKDVVVGQWDADVRRQVQQYLRSRGHFVDEEKVQRFFVHQSLRDLGEEQALEACTAIIRKRLQRVEKRPIGALKGDLQERIPAYVQSRGLFADQSSLDRFEQQTLADLGESIVGGLARHLGRSRLEAAGRISALPQDVHHGLERHLREQDFFTDKELARSFQEGTVADLGEEVHQRVGKRLVEELQAELKQKLIGELDPDIQEVIYRYLEDRDYFLDEEKVRQFDGLTLSGLDAGTVYEVEEQLGQQITTQLEQRKFMNLDQETRESVLHYLDLEGLFRKKKKREQFLRQSLAEVEKGVRDGIAHHLGRARLAQVRETRFADLPEELRSIIWQNLRRNGHFVDEEKKEYLQIEEVPKLDPELRSGIRSVLRQHVEELLTQRKVAELPEGMRASIQRYLEEQGYFLDQARLAGIGERIVGDLDPETYAMACDYIGQGVLDEVRERKFFELEAGLREEIEGCLHGTGYFLDEDRKAKFLQRRLSDVDSEVFEGLVAAFAEELAQEAMSRRVSELDETDREFLREFLDGTGYFVDHEGVAQFEQGLLTDLNLSKSEYDGVASLLGQRWLAEHAKQTFADLEEGLRVEMQQHLRATGFLLDSEEVEGFRQRAFTELDEGTRVAVLQALWQGQGAAIGDKLLMELDEQTRRSVERFLSDRRVALDEAEMEQFNGRTLGDLDEDLTKGFSRYLGHQRLYGMRDKKLAELDGPDREAVQEYMGSQLMHQIEKQLMLGFISRLWVDYLTAIEDLRQGIGLQAYGQMDPLVEYKRRAFGMFGELNDNIRRMVVNNVFRYPPQPLRLVQVEGQE